MSRTKVGAFFDILEIKTVELVLLNKSDRVFNADESGLQINTIGRLARKAIKMYTHSVQKRKGKQSQFLLVSISVEITCHPQLFLKGEDCTQSTRDSFRLVAIYRIYK
jgi:hypothetical protein